MINRVYITRDAARYPGAVRGADYFKRKPVMYIDKREGIPDDHLSFRTLLITTSKGRVLSRCPGSKGHQCCNYLTVDLYIGCGIGCTYCAMRGYLNFAPQTVQVDTENGIKTLRKTALKHSSRVIRVGSGEVGDSLLFDPIFRLNEDYITGVSDLRNVFFETKSKTAFVDHLLKIPGKGNAVIGFSLNPSAIIKKEEGLSASLEERLEAAAKANNAGYLVSFHFDPVISGPDWREAYRNVVEGIRALQLPPEKIAWISLGTFRYTKRLKEAMDTRPYLMDEFIPCRDGKYRYLQKIRLEIYREMIENLRQATNAPVYLCMESDAVWRKLYGSIPGEIPDMSDIFYPDGVEIDLSDTEEV
ncbi:MAG: radical SAM protein [Spirochaetia bacterium]